MIQAVLFDLDGTLADTALDLGGTLNDILRARGLPEIPVSAIRPLAGHGVSGMLKIAGITPEHPDFSALREAYLNRYQQRYADETVLFDGVNTLIAELVRRRIRWGIVTNKNARFTDLLVPRLGFISPPETVVSGDTCPEPKPSPQPLLHACRQLDTAPEHTIYVGDALRDMQAARNAGMTAVLADWGYIADTDDISQWPSDRRIGSPLEVLDLL